MAVRWEEFEAKRGAVPAYVQLADWIEARIRSGALADGDQIPSERALSELVGHSAETVGKAKRLLVERGLADTGRGLGTFVKAPRDELNRVLEPGELLSAGTSTCSCLSTDTALEPVC